MTELVPLRRAWGTILLAGLGYFVDIFDLLLFAVVRVASVRDLGAGDQLLEVGSRLQNTQLVGMMIGGVLWGVIGDRRGRRSVLYGSILLYSVANLLNATATTIGQYQLWRFIAGVGLAGELGAALTLVSELVEPRARGTATTLVATLGVMGAVAAAVVGELVPWRVAYAIGGALGLALLLLRLGVRDSAMFTRVRRSHTERGNLLRLFDAPGRCFRFLRAIAIGVPVWFTTGILITFAPEFARALGTVGEVSAGRAVLVYYATTTLGDLTSGLLSQRLHSRRAAVAWYLALATVGVAAYLGGVARSTTGFYAICGWLGFATGYWAVMVTMAVEQFGTDLRATVATSVPTFVRATAVPMTLAFLALRDAVGVRGGAAVVGAAAFAIAALALWAQSETYGRDLDFTETAARG
ncbi:MAG: MFS transporter [Gemmatimonadaceae bacterium]|nr:MFS transporter [Gemmatimonadaceae bacterium]